MSDSDPWRKSNQLLWSHVQKWGCLGMLLIAYVTACIAAFVAGVLVVCLAYGPSAFFERGTYVTN